MSSEFAGDPDAQKVLAAFSPAQETAKLKGFGKPVPFLRFTSKELAERRWHRQVNG